MKLEENHINTLLDYEKKEKKRKLLNNAKPSTNINRKKQQSRTFLDTNKQK